MKMASCINNYQERLINHLSDHKAHPISELVPLVFPHNRKNTATQLRKTVNECIKLGYPIDYDRHHRTYRLLIEQTDIDVPARPATIQDKILRRAKKIDFSSIMETEEPLPDLLKNIKRLMTMNYQLANLYQRGIIDNLTLLTHKMFIDSKLRIGNFYLSQLIDDKSPEVRQFMESNIREADINKFEQELQDIYMEQNSDR